MRKALIVLGVIIGAIVLFVAYILYVFEPELPLPKNYSLDYATPLFEENVEEFTEMAEQIGKRGPTEFCKMGEGVYQLNGNYFDFTKNGFYTADGPLGGGSKVSYEELLQTKYVDEEQFIYFRNFLDTHPYIECMRVVYHTREPFTGVEFQLPYYRATLFFDTNNPRRGFVYSISGEPPSDRYEGLEQLEGKWHLYRNKPPSTL